MLQHDKLPTALFCCNDDIALSAMDVFEKEKIRVPHDISITGFDDIYLVLSLNQHLQPSVYPYMLWLKKQ